MAGTTILETLIKRDKMTFSEALALIEEAKKQLDVYLAEKDFDAADNICEEFFGLEPDYIMEFI